MSDVLSLPIRTKTDILFIFNDAFAPLALNRTNKKEKKNSRNM